MTNKPNTYTEILLTFVEYFFVIMLHNLFSPSTIKRPFLFLEQVCLGWEGGQRNLTPSTAANTYTATVIDIHRIFVYNYLQNNNQWNHRTCLA